METFLTLVLQVVLAVVVAKLTLAGSRSQKWWERKADLYASLIDKLYDIRYYNSQWLEHYQESDATMSEEETKRRLEDSEKLLKRNRDAEAEVEKLVHIGTFLISDEVHQDLSVFKKAEREALANYHNGKHWGDTYELVDSICDAAKKCIESVREHSKDNLGLNSRLGRLIQKMRALFSE